MDDRGRLELWEATVRGNPLKAGLFGPPSWLVKQGQRPNEEFLDAAARVRKGYDLPDVVLVRP